jgi:hypothetical protein
MMDDLALIMAFGLLGGIVRVLIGYAKNYELGLTPQRAWLALILSPLSGALAAVLIAEDPRISVIAGLGGTDLLEALWRGLARRAAGGVYATSAGVVPVWITERQMEAVRAARRKGKITITEYQELTKKSRATALRDIDALVSVGYLERHGSGRSTYYTPRKKR